MQVAFKKIFPIFLLFLFISDEVYGANKKYWDIVYDVSLKKDEIQRFIVRDPVREKIFYFYWTLFINDGLVVNSNYDKYPKQHVLYKKFKLDAFRVKLMRKANYKREGSYIRVEFQYFDIYDKKALFRIYVRNHKNVEMIEENNLKIK
jgi:hypothetical protein